MGGGGTCDPEGGQSSSVAAVGIDGREAGLGCEDGGGGQVEVVSDSSADPMPEGVHRLGGAVVGDQKVGPVCEDGEEKAHGDRVGQEGASPSPWRGDAFIKRERGVGQSQAAVEVVGGVQGRRQPIAQPSHHPRWVEDLVVEGDGRGGGGRPFTVGLPVDEFGLWDREGDVVLRGSSGYVQEEVLQTAYVGPV